jgi:diadenosine tetraphosphate (Ap4A) HIT family hydrolase
MSAARVLRRTGTGVIAVPEDCVRSGHIMVVSAMHAASFSGLTPADLDGFMALVGAATRAAEEASGAGRYYVLRIGDKSPHLHFHLVPRVEGEEPLGPYVFGDAGWSARVRADAPQSTAQFDHAFSRAFKE